MSVVDSGKMTTELVPIAYLDPIIELLDAKTSLFLKRII